MGSDPSNPWDWSDLYRRARLVGIPAADYWAMTPRELIVELEIAAERVGQEYEAIVAAAWYGEYVHLRAQSKKRLEPLRDYLTRREPQTQAEQMAAMAAIAEVHNIPMRRTEAHEQQTAR